MSRSHGSRRKHGREEYHELDISKALTGWRRTETKSGFSWNVQPIPESRALKVYTCPGCHGSIDEGIAHVVVWRADGIFGDANDLAERRHWHSGCWKASR